MDIAIYKKTYAQITLESEDEINSLVLALESAKNNDPHDSVVKFSTRMLEALEDWGY